MLIFTILKRPYRLWMLSFLTVVACAGLKEPKEIHIVVREKPREVLNQKAQYQLLNARTGLPVPGASGSTNELGYFLIGSNRKPFEELMVAVSFREKKDTLRLTRYVGFYDFYLDNPAEHIEENRRVSDMHYHVSMKSHNAYGQHFYKDLKNPIQPPTNLNWLKIRNKLVVYDQGKWKKPVLKEDISSSSDRRKMKVFLESRWVRSKEGANHLKNFTEATHPHILEGNVFLAYNAISPFEHSVSNDGVKKLVSSGIKSGASFKWLTIMGRKNTFLTHWSNFNREYAMIKNQSTSYNNFKWDHLRVGERLDSSRLSKPLVINVVEGGHILQDRYFPHFINFDLMDSTNKSKRKLYDIIKYRANNIYQDTALLDRYASLENWIRLLPDTRDRDGKILSRKNHFVDSILLAEMYRNVDSLKKMDIHMISIAHLSYNGLVGHAPALDVSLRPWTEWIISKVAQRAYSIRVSSDENYRLAFDGLFYRVPGVNALGDSVINRLLDASDGRRIQIDLKHSDVQTRRLLLTKYEEQSQRGTPVKPICSHCAVNGMSSDYTSPLLNEYRLLKSSLARKFYPFAINLFNEEIKTICEREGIIAIPLEERVLGGYLNNKQERPVCLKRKKGTFVAEERPFKMKRYPYIKRGLCFLEQENDTAYKAVEDYYRTTASTLLPKHRAQKAIRKLIYEEYCSAESFLQNVFHVVDIAYTAKRDSIARTLSERYKHEIELAGETEKLMSSKVEQRLDQTSVSRKTPDKKSAWMNICIGSDFDGLIDPLNICPTASHYPEFKEKLKVLIPLFLEMRKEFERNDRLLGAYKEYAKYFDTADSPQREKFTLQHALDGLFYDNLKNFTQNNFQP